MTLFLGRDISQGKWLEWAMQAYLIQEARRIGLFIEGDQNAAKRSYGAANRAKACGMQSGSPDMRLLCANGKIIWIELKRKKEKLSDNQVKWHKRATELGHVVHTIYAENPKEAWEIFKEIVK